VVLGLSELVNHPQMPQVRAIPADVLEALGVAHHAGIRHRDFKAADILLATSGRTPHQCLVHLNSDPVVSVVAAVSLSEMAADSRPRPGLARLSTSPTLHGAGTRSHRGARSYVLNTLNRCWAPGRRARHRPGPRR
jgi:serine/threonine protein kinase